MCLCVCKQRKDRQEERQARATSSKGNMKLRQTSSEGNINVGQPLRSTVLQYCTTSVQYWTVHYFSTLLQYSTQYQEPRVQYFSNSTTVQYFSTLLQYTAGHCRTSVTVLLKGCPTLMLPPLMLPSLDSTSVTVFWTEV